MLVAAAVSDWIDHLAASRDQQVRIGQLYADLDSPTVLVNLVALVAERLDWGPVHGISSPLKSRRK